MIINEVYISNNGNINKRPKFFINPENVFRIQAKKWNPNIPRTRPDSVVQIGHGLNDKGSCRPYSVTKQRRIETMSTVHVCCSCGCTIATGEEYFSLCVSRNHVESESVVQPLQTNDADWCKNCWSVLVKDPCKEQ